MEDCEEPHMADDQEHHKCMEEASSFSMWSVCRISLNPGCPDQCCSPPHCDVHRKLITCGFDATIPAVNGLHFLLYTHIKLFSSFTHLI